MKSRFVVRLPAFAAKRDILIRPTPTFVSRVEAGKAAIANGIACKGLASEVVDAGYFHITTFIGFPPLRRVFSARSSKYRLRAAEAWLAEAVLA